MKTQYSPISKIISHTNLKQYWHYVGEINKFHEKVSGYSNEELKKLNIEIASKSIDNDLILIQAFALVKEVIIRNLEITPFDVQLLGALALSQNKLIEMQTGEGKTLTAVFAAYLNALDKKGVHILTFNDYLAKRDALLMKPVYEFLGLKVAYINEGMTIDEKRRAYQADITYGTAKEIGFDYLRSFIAYNLQEIFLRPFYYAIIDEADAILIDEARNPLVLAGEFLKSQVDIKRVSEIVSRMSESMHFDRHHDSNNIYLTENGIDWLQNQLSVANLLANEHYELLSAINLALHARVLLRKDVDYVIRGNEIKLVDEFTGRIVEDRKWRNGLQSAVAAKEGLQLKSEGSILNSITLQHFIQKYPDKAAMTATAQPSAKEFTDFYGWQIVKIPANKVCRRIDYRDEIFANKTAKNKSIVNEVKKTHEKGQPILIGTVTIKESEQLFNLFQLNNIPCQVLNAKNDESEAEIIAGAGKFGAVTISTNMAGRGTDILLGGPNGEYKEKIQKLGGLYVIGTNRHESLRVDNQLRGRAGRQGDEGMSRFFISFEDELMEQHELKKTLPERYSKIKTDASLDSKYLNKYIDHIQRVIEGQAFDMRRNLYEYSGFIEKQRQVVQSERQYLLLKHCRQNQFEDKKLETKLYNYDKFWALHLDYLQQVRDSIHLVRLGGLNPLQEFYKKADLSFKEFNMKLDTEIEQQIKKLIENPDLNLNDLDIQKPTSTWTYVINDNPFGNKLGIMLLDNSLMGFQTDPLSAFLLIIYGVIEKFKAIVSKKKRKT